jgi:drug/metabolite transporter (DMT)-like permease
VSLTELAIVLVISSALMHALWNSIGKRTATGASFFAWATLAGTLMFSPLMLINWRMILELPTNFWLLLIVSGAFQAIYFTGLSKAYRSAELSIVYPLARSFPVLIVPVFAFLVHGDTQLTIANIFAMTLIVLGALMLPLKRFRDWHLKSYMNSGVGWALVAALGTAAYSITDSEAVYIMRKEGWDAFNAGSSFVVLQGISIAVWVMGIIKLQGQDVMLESTVSKKVVLLTGFFVMATYLLVLVSMSMVAEVSYIVALRQLSIPIGVAIGALWLKEKLTMARVVGVCVMLVGLVMVVL